jgi:hypothetical protein
MNSDNYATFEQSKKMKELGFPQDKTDFIWIVWKIKDNTPQLRLRGELIKQEHTYCIPDEEGDPLIFFDEWYAAPNAQEIELMNNTYDRIQIYNNGEIRFNFHIWWEGKEDEKCFGLCHEAQSRADTWIWEHTN